MHDHKRPATMATLLLLAAALSTTTACSKALRGRIDAAIKASAGCIAASPATPECQQNGAGTCTCARDAVVAAR